MLRSLALIGFVLQLGGIAVNGWGLRLGWRHTATGGERPFDPVARAVQRWLRRLIDVFRRLVHRPRSQSVAVAGVASAAATASARVSKKYQPLVTDLSLDDKVAELDQRSRGLAAEITRVESQLLGQLQEQRLDHVGLHQTFREYADERERTARQRDIQGIRFQAVGLALVTLGSIIQALGSLLA